MFHSTQRFSRLPLMTLLLVFFVAGPMHAFGTPTYIVYFDGQQGGTIVVQNAPPMPEGACGLRVSEYDTLEWYWAEYGEYGTVSPMPDPFAGPPNSTTNPPGNSLYPLIELTGPFGGDCGDEFVFLGPATGEWPSWPNGTPSGGAALVFQTLPGGVEWLTEDFTLFEPPEVDPEPDPEPPNVCEMFPDLCEEPEFTYDNPCASNSFHCEDATGAGVGAIKAADVLATTLPVLDFVATSTDAKARASSLDDARMALDYAQQATDFAIARSSQLIVDLAKAAPSERSLQEISALQIATDLAQAGMTSCNRQLKALESDSTRSREKPGRDIRVLFSAASANLESLRQAVDEVVAWTIPREDKR